MNAARKTRILSLALAFAAGGCFAERSFAVREEQLVDWHPSAAQRADTPVWTASAASALQRKLPPLSSREVVTSNEVSNLGRPLDVCRLYHLNPEHLDSLAFNLAGLAQTAQVSPPGDRKAVDDPWPGFVDVEIAMPDGLVLCGRAAEPLVNDVADSWVIETHGLFASQQGKEARNVSEALRRYGHHVLAIDMRGHGQTERRNPDYPTTFGASEVGDLIEVARWLRRERGARQVGLLTYSITAQQAMVAAWADGGGAGADDAADGSSDSPMLRALPRPRRQPAFDRVMAVAPPINLIDYADSLERRYEVVESPVRATFQQRIAERLAARGEPPAHSMWQYARHELGRSAWAAHYPDRGAMIADLTNLVDFGTDLPAGAARLERVRVPLLVVASANDPLGSAQSTVDLLVRVRNPNVGLMLLPEGGHTGLSAMSAPYFHSLVRSFFDPATGPVAVARPGGAGDVAMLPALTLDYRSVAGWARERVRPLRPLVSRVVLHELSPLRPAVAAAVAAAR